MASLILPRIAAVVPTHNRAATLKTTIESLQAQTMPPIILVALDNCTDDSERVCQTISVEYFHTVTNIHRKAGAQNQALARLGSVEYVLLMDDDTVLAPDLIERGIEALERDDRLAAICSRAGITRPDAMTAWQTGLWHLQNLEYAGFDAHRVETRGAIKVAHGMATIYRMSALQEVGRWRVSRGLDWQIYKQDNITEDYDLSLALKRLGWRVSASMRMLAWTDVPLSLGVIWRQRVRWLRGGIDSLRDHGWHAATRADILNHLLFWIVCPMQILVSIAAMIALWGGGAWSMSYLVVAALAVQMCSALYRVRYVQSDRRAALLMRLSVIPESLYASFQAAQLVYSYYLSFRNRPQSW